jgi:hypothetical protein
MAMRYMFFCVIVFALAWLSLQPVRVDAQSTETTAKFEVSSVKQIAPRQICLKFPIQFQTDS